MFEGGLGSKRSHSVCARTQRRAAYVSAQDFEQHRELERNDIRLFVSLGLTVVRQRQLTTRCIHVHVISFHSLRMRVRTSGSANFFFSNHNSLSFNYLYFVFFVAKKVKKQYNNHFIKKKQKLIKL